MLPADLHDQINNEASTIPTRERFAEQLRASDTWRRVASELAEYGRNPADRAGSLTDHTSNAANAHGNRTLQPGREHLVAYDRRIVDDDLRAATRSRFVSQHYADSVEAGVKSLCDCVRSKSGRIEDGDALMTTVFSVKNPILRINRNRSQTEQSEQRGHMLLCQGVIGAWRNPRAHSLIDDSPERALMMLQTIQELMDVTRGSTKTRTRRIGN